MWKNRLQGFCQQHGYPLPVYNTQPVQQTSDYNKTPEWCCTVKVHALPEESGVATGKKVNAEQEAARKLCMLVDRIESSNYPPITTKDDSTYAYERVVFVDADHISFIDSDMVATFQQVEFRFYFAFGANLPYLQRVCDFPNVSQFQAPCPASDIADVMICIDVAQTSRDTHCTVVSKDKMLYSLSLLLENVAYLSTKEQLKDVLINKRQF